MAVSRLRGLQAIAAACAGLLVSAAPAPANDSFQHRSGWAGSLRAGASRHHGGSWGHGSHSYGDPNNYWARRWYRVHEYQSQFDPYGHGYGPYQYGAYGYRYGAHGYGPYGYGANRYPAYGDGFDDLGLYERFYLDRYYGAVACAPAPYEAACSLSPVGSPGLSRSYAAEGGRPSVWRSYEQPFSLEQELARLFEASGWTPLSDGRIEHARKLFAHLVERRPARGVPRIGLALATAEQGNRERGVELMREALRIDGSALYDVPVDDRLRLRLGALERHYPEAEFGRDAHFMLAALRYLGGRNDDARNAIERAQRQGDDSESATALRRLIEARPHR